MSLAHARRSSSSLHFATLESRTLFAGPAPVVVPGWGSAATQFTVPLAGGRSLAIGELQASVDPFNGPAYGNFVARYNADGSFDRTFGTNGVLVRTYGSRPGTDKSPSAIRSVFLRQSGAVLVLPTSNFLWQVDGTGKLDATFGGGDGVGAIAQTETEDGYNPPANDLYYDSLLERPDRSISAIRFSLIDTRLPNSFAKNKEKKLELVTLSADGQRIASSTLLPRMSFSTVYIWGRPSVQLSQSGTNFEIRDIDRLADGSIVLTGSRETWSRERGTTNRAAIFKFTPTGAADRTFGGTGVVTYFNVPSEDYGFASNTRPSTAGSLLTSITRSSSSGTTTQDYRVLAWGGLQIV